MKPDRFKFGIATVGTTLGGLYGATDHFRPHTIRGGSADSDYKNIVEYAVMGAILGIVIDLLVNGKPRRVDWKPSRRVLMFLIVACAIFCYGLACFWQVLHRLS